MDENYKKSKVRLGRWIVAGVLAFAMIVVLPNFIRARTIRATNACINNLRQIDAAKQQWALENNKADTDYPVAWEEIKPYLGRGAMGSLDIYCPDDVTKNCSNSYALGNPRTKPKCKINPSEDIIN